MRKDQDFMGTVFFLVLFSLSVFTSGAYADYASNLTFAGKIQDGIGNIDVGSYSTPFVYDWNSDGKKDLLVGQRLDNESGSHGFITYFENNGTNADPTFGTGSYIDACTETCSSLNVAAGG